MNESLILSTISGLLTISKDQEERLARLEIAVETLLNCDALDWKDTVKAVQEDLHEHDADSSLSGRVELLNVAIESIRVASSKQVLP